jgi:hypothetical protein
MIPNQNLEWVRTPIDAQVHEMSISHIISQEKKQFLEGSEAAMKE